MAEQEFLASFGVEIDEAGVTRLQKVLEENRELADRLAAAFDAASVSLRAFAEDLGVLPDFSGRGITTEGLSGFGGLSLGLDLGQARKELDRFTALVKQPLSLKANASGIVSAGQSAWDSLRNLFSTPLTIRAKAEKEERSGSAPARMSSGGRLSRPSEVQVAEDGDAEYIIPVKKESRAVPLVKQLLSELSPSARASLSLGEGASSLISAGLSAGQPAGAQITQNNSNVSAPVTIQVHSTGANAEQIGQKLYDTAERYLLRTLQQTI